MLKERLKQLRKEKGISQYEAAKKLGFSRGKLANYEQGTREPDYDTLEKLADFYDCSLDYLLGRSNLTNNEEEFIYDLQRNFSLEELQKKYSLTIDGKAATEEELKAAITFIRSLRGMK
ncbi:helix-turn-helix domain-containing protein [Oceanobacillus damuensis]|uniref:helix-turn-helix domain-containing protein n=1 Tax=Oceanobacillus damuensis TaxID=937928 RepID=UPI0008329E82|nr:helix-turn-helix domain-containing protein [Oceanobacillus damuensis]